MKSPVVLLNGLLKDFQRLSPDVKGLDRDIITIEKRFENEGYGFLTIALPSLDEALLLGLSSGRFACPSGFKTIRGGTIPRIFSGMFCKVFDPLSGWLKESPDEGVLKDLHQVLRFFKKTQMSSDAEITLHDEAVVEFFRCDDVARQVILPGRLRHMIERVSSLMLNDLSVKPFSEMRFKHGPGAVLEGYRANQKWSALTNSIKHEEFDLESYGYSDYSSSLSELSERAVIAQSEEPVFLTNRASRCTARLITVPKNSTSRRTITVEPLLNQFIQQGLNIALRDSINKCEILRNCLALTDQSKNQKLALEGSLHDNWATIDLKSASDLLSVQLIEAVFRRHETFLSHMMDCRSTHITCGQLSDTELGKFAGMGNALTFPTQSVCFAVLCITAILDMKNTRPSLRNVKQASRYVRVYGDDIIIRSEYVHHCVNWLHDAGLKVNVKKSFLAGNFKESCGVEAYKGVDITPVYCRHRPDQPSTEPSVIAGLVSTSNQLWLQGLYNASTVLRNEIEERLGYSLPLVSSNSGSLGWHSRLDAMTPHKWCRRTHQFLTRTAALVPLKRRDRLDGYAALTKFFHVPLLGRDKDHLSKSSIRYKLRIVLKWVPTYVIGRSESWLP